MLVLLAVVAALKLTVLGSLGLDMWRQLAAQDLVPIPKALAASPKSAKRPAVAPGAVTPDPESTPAMLARNAVPPASVGESQAARSANSREADLAARERALQAMEQSVDAKLAELKRQQAALKALLDKADAVKDERIKRDVITYQAMKSRQAAQVLSTMDESLAVKILTNMKPKIVGEIMSYMRTDQAARLTEAMSRLQSQPPQQPGQALTAPGR